MCVLCRHPSPKSKSIKCYTYALRSFASFCAQTIKKHYGVSPGQKTSSAGVFGDAWG